MEMKTVNQLNKERIRASNTEKAENYEAERNAAREQAKYLFLVAHTGMKAQTNGAYYDCEANDRVLQEYIAARNSTGTDVSHWEEAFENTREQLASVEPAPYETKTNRRKSLFMSQRRETHIPQPAFVPYTREALLEMIQNNLPKFRTLVHRGENYVKEINRILAGK